MKLSLSTCSLNEYLKEGYGEKEILTAISQAGFSCVDYDVHEPFLSDPEGWGKTVRGHLKELNLTAYQAHAPGFNPLDPKQSGQAWKIQAAIRFCGFAGIPALVVHPGAAEGNTEQEFFEGNVAFYRSLIPLCEQTGVRLLIENIGNYADPYFLWDGKALRKMVDAVGSPLCMACWDVGHANHFSRRDCDPYRSILDLGEKLYALHVHDNCGYFADPYEHHRIDMHTMPYASVWCNVNFDAVLKGLTDANYTGTFNLEAMVCNPRIHSEGITVGGVCYDRLRILPLETWIACNRGLYAVGKAMLEAYGVYER